MTLEDIATKQDLNMFERKIESLLQQLSSFASPTWVRREEAAKILGVGFDTLTKFRAEGKIQAAKTDRIIFYNISSLYEYLDSQSSNS